MERQSFWWTVLASAFSGSGFSHLGCLKIPFLQFVHVVDLLRLAAVLSLQLGQSALPHLHLMLQVVQLIDFITQPVIDYLDGTLLGRGGRKVWSGRQTVHLPR